MEPAAKIIAVGVLVALDTANYLGMAPKELKKEVFDRWDIFLKRVVYIIGGFSIFLLPMVPVAFQLFDKKLKAEKEADALARRYMLYFRGKLVRAEHSDEEIQTTGGIHEDMENQAYLNIYFRNLNDMKIWPLDFAGALQMVAAVLGPLSLILIPEAREYLKNFVS